MVFNTVSMRRLNRAEQNERNRRLVLGAARRVFLARGYHGATVAEIAAEAGFSKGVVYSQFGAKADLFMALLEQRIGERAEQNAALAQGASGDRALAALLEQAVRADRAEPAWSLLLIEFRVHAARDPELNSRYAAAHRRTIDGIAAVISALCQRSGQDPPFPARQLAEVVFALSWGAQLEQAASPDALPDPLVAGVLARLFAAPVAADSYPAT
jgi:AcrR family transcriptional regulator